MQIECNFTTPLGGDGQLKVTQGGQYIVIDDLTTQTLEICSPWYALSKTVFNIVLGLSVQFLSAVALLFSNVYFNEFFYFKSLYV